MKDSSKEQGIWWGYEKKGLTATKKLASEVNWASPETKKKKNKWPNNGDSFYITKSKADVEMEFFFFKK